MGSVGWQEWGSLGARQQGGARALARHQHGLAFKRLLEAYEQPRRGNTTCLTASLAQGHQQATPTTLQQPVNPHLLLQLVPLLRISLCLLPLLPAGGTASPPWSWLGCCRCARMRPGLSSAAAEQTCQMPATCQAVAGHTLELKGSEDQPT